MSDKGDAIRVWEAPYFEESTNSGLESNPVESDALAQARGFQVGRDEGLESGGAEAREIVTNLTALVEQMTKPFQGLDEVVTRELTKMTMLLAEQIVRRELSIDSDVVASVVQEAISTLYALEGEISVFLNPADVELIGKVSPEALEGKTWKIVEDPNLLPGGCQVKTPTSFVDASVEKRIEDVFARLIESAEQGPAY